MSRFASWAWGALLLGLLLPVGRSAEAADKPRKIVLIAGAKSHGPGAHEYEKGLRLLEKSLTSASNVGPFDTLLIPNGWPDDDSVLDDADTIVMYCDGSDHDERSHPILHENRLKKIDALMKKGTGFIAIHYTVFVPSNRGGEEFLEWIGGYFDYQNGPAANHWYSKISNQSTRPHPGSPGHPICRGMTPFDLTEEYYYNIRFRPGDTRLKPILLTPIPGEAEEQVVAWAVERTGGGRGFGFTGGHHHTNWGVENYRRMVLNAIVWTAHGEVPPEGVISPAPTAEDLSPGPASPEAIVEAAKEPLIRALILTGYNGPFHDWRATSAELKRVLERDPRFRVTITEDPEFLASGELDRFDAIVQNYVNWDHPSISEEAKQGLIGFLKKGKGFALIHFANGAFRDWPEYQKISRRNWVDGKSNHDPYEPFNVHLTPAKHPITEGMIGFDTTDELYFDQQGELPIEPLAAAHSKVADRDAPLAFAYDYEAGKVFQTLLGHDAASIAAPGVAELIRRGCAWAAGGKVIGFRDASPNPIATSVPSSEPAVDGRFGKALNPSAIRVEAAASVEYSKPPLTVECWAKLENKDGFNILVANHPKESGEHWEIYSYAGSGNFSVYMPGMAPAEMVSKVNIVDGQWHYLAWVHEGARSRLFVDGKNVLDVAITSMHAPSIPGPLFLGGIHPIGLGCMGVIDELRISNVAREIGATPTFPLEADEHTLDLWRFDQFENGFEDIGSLKSAAVKAAASSPPPVAIQKAAGPSSADKLDYKPTNIFLGAILIDRSPDESFLAVRVDSAGRIFVGGREALLVYEPKSDGTYAPKKELYRFPPDSWLAGIEILGDDVYVMTCSALYRLSGARLKRDGIQPERLIWGIPVDLHVSFHGLALGPEGDLYFTSGDPLLNYGDFQNRPDHWGHWTIFSKPDGTKTPYTGQGGVFRCRPDGTKFQVVAGGTRGSNGIVFDRDWNLFTNDNDHESLPALYTPGRLLHVTPHADFGWPRGWTAARTPDRADLLDIMFNGMGRAVPVGMAYYDDAFLPESLSNSLLMARWCTLQLTQYSFKARGASFSAEEKVFLTGTGSARPVGVAVGRGGRIFAAISYMTQNEWSPRYISDLVMITLKNDAPDHPFEAYEAASADESRLWSELKSEDWQRRYQAHEEILRRGGRMPKEAAERGRRYLTKPKLNEEERREMTHLIWLGAASEGSDIAMLDMVSKRSDAGLRLQAVRAFDEYRESAGTSFDTFLSDPDAQVRLAAVIGLFNQRMPFGDHICQRVAEGPGAEKDTYLRQCAAKLLARRASLEQLAEIAKNERAEVRMAAVLALGFRLTVPEATAELPKEIPLNYTSENAKFDLQYADAKIDLKQQGRIGSFTSAEAWSKTPHTQEMDGAFGILAAMLDDTDAGVRLETAFFLDLLDDTRSRAKVAEVKAGNLAAKLAGMPKTPVQELWVVGPFDANDKRMYQQPADHAVALDASYGQGPAERIWESVKSEGQFNLKLPSAPRPFSYYGYFRFQSVSRQPVRLEIAHRDALSVWVNAKMIWENAGVQGAVPTLDTIQVDLEQGSTELVFRVVGRDLPPSFSISYQVLPGTVMVLPEKLGMRGLTERLKSAAQGGDESDIPPEFLSANWEMELRKGNAENGRKLFGVDGIGCVKCHSISADQAGAGAPSLADCAKRFTLAYLIESVLLPSRQIADVFRGTLIETRDGETLTGLLTGETADKIDMLLSDATRRSINKADIKERRPLQLSPMPQGLVKTTGELRDILAFLLTDASAVNSANAAPRPGPFPLSR